LSLVHNVVRDLVDGVLDQLKQGLDDYAETARQDIELFVDSMLRRVVRAMAVGVLGSVLVSAGFIFSLLGLVNFLSQMINPALAWSLVGLGMVGLGSVLILPLLKRNSRGLKHASRFREGN
jgi:hypothetical protein